tara:strand:+ start:152 stop:637 length:486 start_codon:yes stop_codon:yes gene_type:complete
MQERGDIYKDKFSVEIILVVFKYGETSMKVGVLNDHENTFTFPECKLKENENTYSLVDELINKYVSMDRTSSFSINLCALMDGPDRYYGDSGQRLSLVFRLDIPENFKTYENMKFIDGADSAELVSQKRMTKDHGEALQMVLTYGFANNKKTNFNSCEGAC